MAFERYRSAWNKANHTNNSFQLTAELSHCGLVRPYGNILLGQHCVSGNESGWMPDSIRPVPESMLTNHQWGLVALHFWATSQEMLKISIFDMSFKINIPRLQPHLPVFNKIREFLKQIMTILDMSLKITILRVQPHLPGVNELRQFFKQIMTLKIYTYTHMVSQFFVYSVICDNENCFMISKILLFYVGNRFLLSINQQLPNIRKESFPNIPLRESILRLFNGGRTTMTTRCASTCSQALPVKPQGVWARCIEAWAGSRDLRNVEFRGWGSSGPSSLMQG